MLNRLYLKNVDKYVYFDSEDLDIISRYKWTGDKLGNTYYASTRINDIRKSMHSILRPDLKMVDHKDGDGLNNQRNNLRETNKSTNGMNRLPNQGKKSSKFKGVWWDSWAGGRWAAGITLNGKAIKLGRFYDEVEAAQAYDEAAEKLHGDFARTNKMMGLY